MLIETAMTISKNLQKITNTIQATAHECGRDPDEIQLVAVSKKFPTAVIEEAIQAGQTVFGENYIQEAQGKIEEIGGKASFHFIGHLQSNKAKIAAQLFNVIETVDSLKLAANLDKHLKIFQRTLRILIQVNIGEDPNKSGAAAVETEKLLLDIAQFSNLHPVGLMTMPPYNPDGEASRIHFRHLRELAENLTEKKLFSPHHKVELSMGMSHDYSVAIQEGATIIRIGTAIFGQRQY